MLTSPKSATGGLVCSGRLFPAAAASIAWANSSISPGSTPSAAAIFRMVTNRGAGSPASMRTIVPGATPALAAKSRIVNTCRVLSSRNVGIAPPFLAASIT